MIGQTISHYEITAKLGAGGMGEVYLATDSKLDREVALKFLPVSLKQDPEARERLLREAKAASRLSHPNIMTIYSVEQADGRDFIVMEYIKGLGLDRHIQEHSPRLNDIMGLAIGIASGLAKAHEAGITHRDLKPANILVDADARARILDFGVARIRGAPKLTKTGTTVGTLAYMSPEQSRGDEADHRSDLFSFGVILYEMIAGQPPFGGEHEAAILYAIANEEPEPLARFKSDVPEELQRIVSKCLAKNPKERYQNAADLITDLKQVKKSLVQTPVPARATTKTEKRARMNIIFSATAVAAIALVLLIMKPWTVEIQPTQDAAAGEDRLAVMYFDNLANPDDPRKLGEITTNLLITDLSQSRYVKVVSSQRLYDVLKALGREGTKTIDREVATQVAVKAGAKWMMLGSILQEEPQIVLTAQLVEVASGNVLASQRVIGAYGERIFSLVDRLTVGIKKDLALPAAALDEVDPQIVDITSSSTEAYAHYLEGIDNHYKFLILEAKESFLRALELDSTLATAYYGLSLLFGISTRAEQEAAIAKAMQYSDGAGDLDHRYIRARFAALANDVSEATRELEGILAEYPDEKVACFRLALLYETRNVDKSLAMLNRAIAIDPLYKDPYNQLAYRYTRTGQFDKGIWAINKYIELAPDEPNPYDSRGDLYAQEGHLDEAAASYQMALDVHPGFVGSVINLGRLALYRQDYDSARTVYQSIASQPRKTLRARGRYLLSDIPIYRGRFREAIRQIRSAIDTDRMEIGDGPAVAMKLWSVGNIYAELGQVDSAITTMREARDILEAKDPNNDATTLVQGALIIYHARRGDDDTADSLMQRLTEDFVRSDSVNGDRYWAMHAYLAFERKDYQSAAQSFERSLSLGSVFPVLVGAARTYYAQGRLADAVAMFEKAERWHDGARSATVIWSVRVHYWLAQAYEKSGWNDKAIEQYDIFLSTWKDADPGIAEIDDAQARLERLKGQPG